MTRPNLSLVALHLGGNALLLWLGYYWLGTGESRTLTLLWSFAVALLLVCLTCLLHGATFVFVGQSSGLSTAFRTALRNLLPILVAAFAVLAVYLLLSRWADYSSQPAFKIASWLTLKLRKPVKPSTILRIFNVVTWLFRWVILPLPLLPMISGVASKGWRGFTHFGKLSGKRLYWLQAPVLLLCSFWLPLRLIGWVPQAGSFVMEILSFAARLLFAYLLFVASWLLLAFLTSAGKPVLSHSRTVVSP
ncbi:conserved membrane hypothetical protein [Candidatus Sulfopaludibacter sp. SbA6]|nr:conserved membrane hypothetical protein [Candidatus Sulfopaludibacter sp. SbA6]